MYNATSVMLLNKLMLQSPLYHSNDAKANYFRTKHVYTQIYEHTKIRIILDILIIIDTDNLQFSSVIEAPIFQVTKESIMYFIHTVAFSKERSCSKDKTPQ